MALHFETWGWISFLSTISETKIFDISGLDSIESAKRAKLYNVLVFSSEKKDKEDYINAIIESKQK